MLGKRVGNFECIFAEEFGNDFRKIVEYLGRLFEDEFRTKELSKHKITA